MNKMKPVNNGSAQLREGRDKNQRAASARLPQGIQFRSDVAAQSRVRLFVKMRGSRRPACSRQPANHLGGLGWRNVPRFAVDHEHIVLAKQRDHVACRTHADIGTNPLWGKLDPEIHGPGQIIGND